MNNSTSIKTDVRSASKVGKLPGLLQGRDNTHAHVETLLDPIAFVLALWIAAFAFDSNPGTPYLFVTLILATQAYPGRSRLHVPYARLITDLVFLSTTLTCLLIFFGWATHSLDFFPRRAVLHWLWITPLCLIAAHLLFRVAAPLVLRRTHRVVVVGMNDQGMALAERIMHNPYTDLSLVGFFDDRDVDRLKVNKNYRLLGRFAHLSAYVKAHNIQVIYLSLPMATQERTMRLLDELRDTTASIYFVPDQFVTELIQARSSVVVDIPVVAVCETPFVGVNGVLKRLVDIALAAAATTIFAAVFVVIALLVKLSSPGPIIFCQRRYGLDGKEIIVYKFRSMRVVDDGALIQQATRNDARVTPIGALLRRTSLDELPQLINVLQGRMSLVGPRPHAVAHNELYRKVIKGYMLRHKVRPGITGWAQINGSRGETDTIAKMEERIQYDIDYLRNWSLRLDFYILVRTVLLVFYDRHAY